MTTPPAATAGADTGLLSPVRASTPVETAVNDEAWLQAMLDAEAALARAQARLGLIPQDSAEAIGRAARHDRFDLVSLARRAREAANPVVALVADLTEHVADGHPAAADHVHRGSTSQDILDSAAMLVAARALDLIHADTDRITRALAGLAREHRDTPMAARTLTQHAVPTTFGLKAAGWLHAVHTAALRTAGTARNLPAQFGGAAGTLAAYHEYALLDGAAAGDHSPALDLAAVFAEELGLADPVLPWHTSRAPVAALAADLALLTGTLGKFGLDVQNMARTEVGEAAEPAADGRGASSAMPQKRNPVLSALLVSAAVQAPGHAATVAQCLLAEDERPAGAWQAEWQPLRELLRLAGGAAHTAAELAEGLTVFPDRMAANLSLTHGQVCAERLAAHLTSALGKAAAKKCITALTRTATRRGIPFAQALAESDEVSRLVSGRTLAELLDPARYLGAGTDLVDRALQHHAETMDT